MQAVVDVARLTLNDADKVTWPDDGLLPFYNAAIHRAVSIRPDLFIGRFTTLPTDQFLPDTFPLPARYERAVADYIIGRAETSQDEAANAGRAVAFSQLYDKELLGL